jgi:hypothetical protein
MLVSSAILENPQGMSLNGTLIYSTKKFNFFQLQRLKKTDKWSKFARKNFQNQ